MTPAAYLDATKKTLNMPSDYALAKAIGVRPARITMIRKGERPMDEAEIIFIATSLQIDPAQVMAELAEPREKNPKKKELLKGFLSRAAILAALCCTLALTSFGGAGNAQAALGGSRRRSFA